jgi:hypothetical protein
MGSISWVKFERSRGYCAVSRYAIAPALYRVFEHDPEKRAPVFRKDRAPETGSALLRQFDKRATDPY